MAEVEAPSADALSAGERLWEMLISHFAGLAGWAADDVRRIELLGEMHKLAGPPPEPLLLPFDIAFLVIGEKVDWLAKRFLPSGPLHDRVPEFDALEKAAVVLAVRLHLEVLRAAELYAKDEELRGSEEEAWGILKRYRLWLVHTRNPAIEALRQRLPRESPLINAMFRGDIAAPDRMTRLAIVDLARTRKTIASPAKTLGTIRRAIQLHEAYKPPALRDGEEILTDNKLVGAVGLARALETQQGFTKLVWWDQDKELAVSMMPAKDGIDVICGRWHEEKSEPCVGSLDDPLDVDDADSTLHEIVGEGSSSDAPSAVEVGLARDAVASLGLTEVLKEILDSIDSVAPGNPEAALVMAANVVRLVGLLRDEPTPGIRAGILFAWARAAKHRGSLSRKAVGAAFGVSAETVKRREAEGRRRLAAAGL